MISRREVFKRFARAAMQSHTSTECAKPGYVLCSGQVNTAEHEMADGWFAIGVGIRPSAIVLSPGSSGWLHLRELRGWPIELVARKLSE